MCEGRAFWASRVILIGPSAAPQPAKTSNLMSGPGPGRQTGRGIPQPMANGVRVIDDDGVASRATGRHLQRRSFAGIERLQARSLVLVQHRRRIEDCIRLLPFLGRLVDARWFSSKAMRRSTSMWSRLTASFASLVPFSRFRPGHEPQQGLLVLLVKLGTPA